MKANIRWGISILIFIMDIVISWGQYTSLPMSMLMFIFFYGVGTAIHLALHEIGHFMGGKLSGYELVYFALGSFIVSKGSKGRLEFDLVKRKGGQCIMCPTAIDNKKYVLYNLGGIIVNVLLVLVGIKVYIHSSGIIRLFFLQFIFAGIPKIVLNSVPSMFNGLPNDAFIIRLLYFSELAKRDYNIYLILFADLYYNREMKNYAYHYQRKLEGKYDSLIYYNEIQQIFPKEINSIWSISK